MGVDVVRIAGAGGGGAHDVLSTEHTDSDAADVPAAGDVLTWVAPPGVWRAEPGGAPGAHTIDGASHTGTLGLDDAQLPAPPAGYPVDVAAAESDGVATTPARSDHGHAHGSGYLANAHHSQLHAAAHAENAGDELLVEDLGTAGLTANRVPKTDGLGGLAIGQVDHGELAGVTADQHHAQSHAHSSHTGIGIDDHHARDHDIDGATHTQSGGTAGRFLRETGATTFTFEAVPFSAGATILDPTGARFVMVWRAPFACTVTNVRGHRKGGTGATVNARRNQTSDHLAADLSLVTADAWADGGAVQNTAYIAGDDLEVEIASIAGAVTEIAIQVDFTRP